MESDGKKFSLQSRKDYTELNIHLVSHTNI